MAEYCKECSKKLKKRDSKYKQGYHRGYCMKCLRTIEVQEREGSYINKGKRFVDKQRDDDYFPRRRGGM